MKTIGMIGGMSWESSLDYYRLVNQLVKRRLGGLHSASCLMLSIDFAPMEAYQRAGQWEQAGQELAAAAVALESAGAGCIVLCTNTMHKVAPAILAAIRVPFLHIADPTAERVRQSGLHRVGLLGTRFTMEEDFYRGRLEDRFGLQVLIPEESERAIIHRVIYEELVMGVTLEPSRRQFLDIIAGLGSRGAEGIILGCTEIGMLVKPEDTSLPLFDTTRLHAEAAVDFALQRD